MKEKKEHNDQEEKIRQVAHDMRGALTVIGSFLKFVPLPQNDTLRELHAASVNLVKKLEDMVESLRQNQSVNTPKLQEHDVAKMLQTSVKEMSHVAQQKGIEVEYVGPPSLPGFVDPRLMDRVVTNLITNSVQASQPGRGSITVNLSNANGSMYIGVSDNGKGIPAEHLEKIFLPGFTHGKADGTGIGLDVCKQVVEGHGGHIKVHSKPLCGTVFTTMIPAAFQPPFRTTTEMVIDDDTLD